MKQLPSTKAGVSWRWLLDRHRRQRHRVVAQRRRLILWFSALCLIFSLSLLIANWSRVKWLGVKWVASQSGCLLINQWVLEVALDFNYVSISLFLWDANKLRVLNMHTKIRCVSLCVAMLNYLSMPPPPFRVLDDVKSVYRHQSPIASYITQCA